MSVLSRTSRPLSRLLTRPTTRSASTATAGAGKRMDQFEEYANRPAAQKSQDRTKVLIGTLAVLGVGYVIGGMMYPKGKSATGGGNTAVGTSKSANEGKAGYLSPSPQIRPDGKNYPIEANGPPHSTTLNSQPVTATTAPDTISFKNPQLSPKTGKQL